jgi:hypothetical protein
MFDRRQICLNDNENEHSEEFECNLTEIDLSETLIEDQMEHEWIFDDTNYVPEQIKELSLEENQKFNKIINDFENIFAKNLNALREPCSVGQFEIKLTDTTPIFLNPYRKSFKERQIIKDEINKMLDAHVIRPSHSPWSSPILLLPKPDGGIRFCVDFRKLNRVTVQDKFPMPRIDDIFDRLQGSKYFSEIDLNSAFWLLKILEQDIEKTAFSTPDGNYEFTRLPFGVANGTRAFQRLMYNIYGHNSFIEIYLDNLIVHSKDCESHLNYLKLIYTKARETNLKLNLRKCKFFQTKIKLLGHIISEDKILMDPSKIEKIQSWPIPRTTKHVQQFLGLANYYHHFIQNFAEKATPLYQLTLKNQKFKWSEDTNEAFEQLKFKLCSYPILRPPNLLLPFTIYTDASALSAGAILSQTDDTGEYVVSYNSKKFKNAELHYSVTEKECLAVLWAIKHYRVYLDGVLFTIITDHRALKWLMDIKEPHGRLARWAIYLQSYNFNIVDRPGIQHINADAMSRINNIEISNIIQNEKNIDHSQKALDVWEDSTLLYFLKNLKHKPGASKKQVKRINEKSKHYVYDKTNDKIWYYSDTEDTTKILEVPKIDERFTIILKIHLLGHMNARKHLKD